MLDYLLDTNVCVWFLRGRQAIADKIVSIGQEHLFISEMTVGELLYGAMCSDRPSENVKAVNTLCEFINVLPTTGIWNEFARQKACLRRNGTPIEDADIIIGSTAIVNGMVMVTGNIKHLCRLDGIQIECW